MDREGVLMVGGMLRMDQAATVPAARMPTKLVLFDIDGTLSPNGDFAACLTKAAEEVLGITITPDSEKARIKMGSTIGQWVIDATEKAGVPKDRVREIADSVLALAEEHFAKTLAASALKPYEGVAELLKELTARGDVVIGIVTNNLNGVMYLKMESNGLLAYFTTDGIMESASMLGDKSGSMKVAISKAEEKFGVTFDRGSIFYVGDHVSDMKAGKAVGIKTIGVGTGRSTLGELANAGADIVVAGLSDSKTVLAFIDAGKVPQKSRCT